MEQPWWRTTPVATKAWHYGAGGADTYARPAPSTGEDEGSRVSLHQVRPSSRHDTFRRARARGAIFSVFYFIMTLLARTCLSGPLHVSLSLSLCLWVGFPLFWDPSLRPFPFCEPLFYFYEYGCGLWASSGPFPLLARQGLYKRGRDPPTNPSRHLRKEESSSRVAAQGKLGKKSYRRRRRRCRRTSSCRRLRRRLRRHFLP